MLTRAQIAEAATGLVDCGHQLWLASNDAVLRELNLEPCGIAVTPLDFLGPYEREWKLEDLMRTYNVLNATAFGAKGIPLQNWVMIDLGLLPSAFLLVTLPRAVVEDALAGGAGGGGVGGGADERRRARMAEVLPAVLAEADRLHYPGPIPVAGYCAAPTPDRAAWVGWSLCSAVPGLGSVAKGLALEAYGARSLTGVAQFYDPSLRVHRKFGPMRLLAAVLDLHPVSHTMAYRTEVFGPEETDPAHPEPTLWLDARDRDAQWALQTRLDAGTHEYFILSPGLVEDRVPILERLI
jgi:hypothetical protein